MEMSFFLDFFLVFKYSFTFFQIILDKLLILVHPYLHADIFT